MALGCTKLEQIAYLGSCVTPLLPVAHPHSPAQPLIYFGYHFVVLRDTVVVHPAAQIQGKLLHSVLHGDKPAAAGQLLDAPLELGKGCIRPADFATYDGKTQKAGMIHFIDLALGLVDLELELAFNVAFDRSHYEVKGVKP